MTAFRIVFTLSMLLFPIGTTWCYRARGENVDRELLRRRRRRLHLATATALALAAFLWIGHEAGWLAFWSRLPRYMTWSESLFEICWILSFPLWFGFAMPVILAARPEMAGPHPSGVATRVASLTSRTATAAVPRARWLTGWAIWACGAAAIAAAAADGAPPDRCVMAAFFLVGGGLPPLLVTPWALRRLPAEAEPLDPTGSPELVEAYASLRDRKARGFASMALAMVAMFTTVAVVVVLWPDRPALIGIAGGLGGTLVGVWGAVFGARMSRDRAEIRKRLEELSRNSE